ncbi:MAG: DUF1566 domain-containing protein [Kangiellaceae bacterium]|nr:DUF1566 domain-containing protein [Kangiellaceae bacterium]
MNNSKLVIGSLLIVVVSSCGGGGGSSSSPLEASNVSPIANAGDDQNVDEQTSFELNGSGSDSDGSINSYSWVQVSGEQVELNTPTMATTSLTTPMTIEPLDLEFDLTVTDNESANHTDRIVITVLPVNALPEIFPYPQIEVLETESVQLRPESNDFDGEVESVFWEQVAGTDVGLLPEQLTNRILSFDTPSLSSSETAVFRYSVTDNEGGMAEADIEVVIHDSHDYQRTNGLTDTGAILCGNYADSGEPDDVHANNIDCTQTEFPNSYPVPAGQDGHYGLDTTSGNNVDGLAGLRYVKLDSDGEFIPDDSEEWSCVLDRITGLIWEVKHEGPEITGSHNRFSWFSENPLTNGGDDGAAGDSVGCALTELNCNTSTYLNIANEGLMCGNNDMRLPTPRELMGLISLKEDSVGTKVDTRYFPFLHVGNSRYWTSTSYSVTPAHAFMIDFATAKLIYELKSNANGVLLVHHYQP